MGLEIKYLSTGELTPYENNSRTHSDEQIKQIEASIREFGFTNPILIDDNKGIIAGHGRIEAAKNIGMNEVPTITLSGLTEAQRRAYIIADNKLALNAGWDEKMLALEVGDLQAMDFDVELLGFSDEDLEGLLIDEGLIEDGESNSAGSLADKFGVPPFSVISARDGWWQDRKRAWLSLGIKSELGRDDNLMGSSDLREGSKTGYKTIAVTTSVFDPVLCELVYRWFCPDGGLVLDPFSGGSVRGVVASHTGRQYIGHELRDEQVKANKAQVDDIAVDPKPVYITGDSRNIDKTCSDVDVDLIFSCPPYADLEVYSDDPSDLSTLSYKDFRAAYYDIINKSCARLKQNRFACFVVGEVRDKKGNYYNFVGDTVKAFLDAGLDYYNEAILVTQAGTVAMTAERPFKTSRKLGKTHQNILVFVKGDAKKATQSIGECEFGDMEEECLD